MQRAARQSRRCSLADITGGEKLITQCCTSDLKRPKNTSDPGFDRLVLNLANWTAWYGLKVRTGA
jgi:hypothetical protein